MLEGYEDYTVMAILLFLVGFGFTAILIYDYTINTSSFWNILAGFGVNLTYQPYIKPEVVYSLVILSVFIIVGVLYAYRRKLFIREIVVRT